MDPQACLFDALDNMRDMDGEAAAEHLRNLADWIECGGLLPAVGRESGTLTVTRKRPELSAHVATADIPAE